MENLMGITIIPDKVWEEKAPRPPDPNPITEQRLSSAHASLTTSSSNENSTKALKLLLNFGLIPDCTSSNKLARYIADTLLNYPNTTQHEEVGDASPKYTFQLVLSPNQNIAIPLRSKLLLWFLSNKLKVNIYIFSSRSNSICYKCPTAESSIAFFHRIDSYYNVSEYLVIASSSHVTTIRELSSPTVKEFSSNVKVAEFKEGKRRNVKRTRPENDELSTEECIEAVYSASQTITHSKIVDVISSVLKKKKFKGNDTKESLLAERFEITKRDLINAERIPRKTMDIAHELILGEYPDFTFANFAKRDIEARLGSEISAFDIFHWYIRSNFDSMWESTLAECENKTLGQTNEEGSEGECQDEDSGHEDKATRTCTVTLNSILRPDLVHVEEFISMINTRQADVTNVIDELSILAHKTVLTIASGEMYNGSFGQTSEDPKTFDISYLLPDFELRSSDVQSKISVAPIPPLLQGHLEEALQKDSKSIKDDVSLMLTQPHLQFLNARFLGTQGAQGRVEGRTQDVPQGSKMTDTIVTSSKNPVWERGACLIQPTSSTEYPPTSAAGISKTINEHVRQFSTAIQNLWSGSVYQKSLDYLLRILLRIRLAPLREAKFYERTHRVIEKEGTERKPTEGMEKLDGDKGDEEQPPDIDRKKWKRMVMGLCDELSVIIQPNNTKENKFKRLEQTLKRLKGLQMNEPTTRKNSLLPLDERIKLLADDSNSTKTSGVEDEESSIKRLMDLDGQVLDDLEYLEEIVDEDDDEYPEELEQEHQMEPQDMNTSISKEPTRGRLKALQSVLRTLLESPHIEEEIDSNWVMKMSFVGNKFTLHECEVVADLANKLRPYVPKQWSRSDGHGLRKHSPHVALRAPLVILANTVLRATGYSKFCRRISPLVSPASLYGLQLGAVGMFEVFCGRSESHFDVLDSNNELISNKESITTVPEHRSTIFEAFLDMKKVNKICLAHGIQFSNRITYIDPLTVIITGEVIPHGDNRRGYPVISKFEQRKKQKAKNGNQNFWAKEFISSGMDKETLLEKASIAAEEVKQLESKVRPLRKETSEKLTARSMASKKLCANDPLSYGLLREARQSLHSTRKQLISYETELRYLKQELYRLNQLVKASASKTINFKQASKGGATDYTQPTWEHPAAEDRTDKLDLSPLINSRGKKRAVVYGGTDYGVCTMSETVAFSEGQIIAHINRYSELYDHPDNNETKDSDPVSSDTFQSIKVPKSFKITAPQLHHISQCHWTGKKRERRLRRGSNKKVRKALKDVADSGKVLCRVSTFDEIDKAQHTRRANRDALRQFEHSRVRVKELRNQRLRSRRALVKQGAAERRYLMHYGQKDNNEDGVVSTSSNSSVPAPPQLPTLPQLPPPLPPPPSPESPTTLAPKAALTRDGWCADCKKHHIPNHPEAPKFEYSDQCPKSKPQILPIMMIGTEGTGVGSTISGHIRRGGSKMRTVHSRNCTVAMTPEYRTSKTCIYCFQQVELALSRRIIKGQEKMVKVNGAVECINTNCIAFRNGCTIRGRDSNAAAAMAISGASLHYNTNRRTLPPFSPQLSRNTTKTSQYTGLIINKPPTSMCSDAMEALPVTGSQIAKIRL